MLRHREEGSSGAEAAHVEGGSHTVATSGSVDLSDIIEWAQISKSRAWISVRLLVVTKMDRNFFLPKQTQISRKRICVKE